MLRTGIALGALGLLTPSIALAQALPVMSDGYSVETYPKRRTRRQAPPRS